MTDAPAPALDRRRCGILLHPTSLPGPGAWGNLGADAYRFVDFLVAAGQSVWQMLPVGPTHDDGSPYLALSVHAGDPRLISLEALSQWEWLEPLWRDAGTGNPLALAYTAFQRDAPPDMRGMLAEFAAAQSHWLDDYALYTALKAVHGGAAWMDWPAPLRDREPVALGRARTELASTMEQTRFEQFLFFHQWYALKHYANERGLRLFGDLPIFVAHDSADVWSRREFFDLDNTGQARVVAGVPPDYFSATGQRWGNPHYRWDRLQADGFRWWVERLRTQLNLFDIIRIDHFRGFEAYWEIRADCPTAVDGRWVEAPGDALFKTLREVFGVLPLVAEDLGLITPAVHALRRKYGLPGMKVLQFAFDGGPDNPYLPHQHKTDYVVYTGTHDNDTTVGWFTELSEAARAHVLDYLGEPRMAMPWPLIRAAFMSVAKLAVVPMQDVLELGSADRMNRPGVANGNWTWRFTWEQVPEGLAEKLQRLAHLYGRR